MNRLGAVLAVPSLICTIHGPLQRSHHFDHLTTLASTNSHRDLGPATLCGRECVLYRTRMPDLFPEPAGGTAHCRQESRCGSRARSRYTAVPATRSAQAGPGAACAPQLKAPMSRSALTWVAARMASGSWKQSPSTSIRLYVLASRRLDKRSLMLATTDLRRSYAICVCSNDDVFMIA